MERRRHQRIKKTAVINFSVPEKIQNCYGLLRDLCAGGMQISTNEELRIGDIIQFNDTESLPFTFGAVRWCHPRDGLYLIGIEFSQPLKADFSSSLFHTSEKNNF